MKLAERIDLLVQLGKYISDNGEDWQEAKRNACIQNPWFLPEFIEQATETIVRCYLQGDALRDWLSLYPGITQEKQIPKKVGIVMAGNIPLVGFHDFLCVFISGHQSKIKLSSKDEVLLKHLVAKLTDWAPGLAGEVQFAELLKNCEAYIATGSNSSAGHFDYYFRNYPHIIRRNRSSVALLDGQESPGELELLADDVYQYFGLGCRNITKIYVPRGYNFLPLITAFNKYNYLADHHKYKNNYDYNLALHILNNKFYMSNPSILIVEDAGIFSPVSQLHYEYYANPETLQVNLQRHPDIQCIVGKDYLPFGQAQHPGLSDYADGIDTMKWLEQL